MVRRVSQSEVNSAIRKLQSSANELKRLGRQMESAGRDYERKNRQAQARLRNLSHSQPSITSSERVFLDSVREHVACDPVDRPHDIFLSHATADLALARELYGELQNLGAEVWLDDFSIKLGHNIVRAIDHGILSAKVGIVLVTPSVIAGRYWVEREFSALLNTKDTVIPILHGVNWGDLAKYSPLLHLNRGLSTADHSVAEIAELVVGTLG